MESAWISCYRVFFTFRRLMSLSPSLRNTQLLSSGSTSGRSPREKLQLLRSMYFHWPCSTDPFIPQSQLLLGHSAHPPPVSRCRVHPALPPHKCCDRTPGKVRYPCLKPAELTTTWSSSDQGYIYRTSSLPSAVSGESFFSGSSSSTVRVEYTVPCCYIRGFRIFMVSVKPLGQRSLRGI